MAGWGVPYGRSGSAIGTSSTDVVWEQPPPNLTAAPQWLCPDLLRYEQIGAADGLRGRVVRAFFWLLKAWPTSWT